MPANGRWVSAAAAVSLVGVFFPWLLVSCNEQPVMQANGWQLATGGTVPSQFGPQQLPSNVLMFMLPALAIATLVMAFRAFTSGSTWRSVGTVAIVSGLVSLVELVLVIVTATTRASSQETGQMFQVRPEFGFWLEIIANLALVVFGYGLRRETRETTPLPAADTPAGP